MKLLPPVAWRDVTPGTVIMDHRGVTRTVLDVRPTDVADLRLAFIEGLPPYNVLAGGLAHPVELDDTDAIGTLFAAGLNPTPIKET